MVGGVCNTAIWLATSCHTIHVSITSVVSTSLPASCAFPCDVPICHDGAPM